MVGITAPIEDVERIEDEGQGFAQLAYSLIKLGSHIIEQKLLVYGPASRPDSASAHTSSSAQITIFSPVARYRHLGAGSRCVPHLVVAL